MKKLKFHERFQLPVDLDRENKRFVQGVKALFMTNKLNGCYDTGPRSVELPRDKIKEGLALHFVEQIDPYWGIQDYIPSDFLGCLEAIEVVYKTIYVQNQKQLYLHIQKLLKQSRLDLGVRFENRQFFPEGSELLDEKLLDDVLNCLTEEKHANILEPFKRGLRRFSESTRDESKLKDVIEDMYESTEAFAKFINNNDKDLSENREKLIKNLKLNEYYKKILSQYIQYACSYRHAVRRKAPRPKLNKYEIEAFIYLTGIFIRLGIKIPH